MRNRVAPLPSLAVLPLRAGNGQRTCAFVHSPFDALTRLIGKTTTLLTKTPPDLFGLPLIAAINIPRFRTHTRHRSVVCVSWI